MARLYDHIMAGLLGPPAFYPTAARAGTRSGVIDKLADATVIVADNVASYYFMGDPKNVWLYDRDFPNLAPPLDKMWIEFRPPRTLNINGTTKPYVDGPKCVGVLVESERRDNGSWMCSYSVFLAWKLEREPQGPLGNVVFGVTGQGRYDAIGNPPTYNDGNQGIPVLVPYIEHIPQHQRQEYLGSVINLAKPALLAVSFMHCKNVDTREVSQPAPLSKKWAKKHGRPLVRYHVLDIDPMRKVLKSEGRSDEVGLKKALHICRGHFATYTQDAPLFGRVTGTFWRPQHVRGSATQGAVVKDYNVKAPRDGAT